MKSNRSTFFLATLVVIALVLVPTLAAQEDDPILVGHLTYQTGPFAAFGDFFDGVTDFTLEIINQDPPLGRPMEVIHQDIGTIGEARAARKLVESDGVDVLLGTAHEYLSYREWMLDYIADNNAPLMPSVHGGAVEREIGGVASEPFFRGSPMDTAQGVAAVLQAEAEGAERIVVVATEIAGSQLQKGAALNAAEQLGLEVVADIDVLPEQPTYRSAITRIAGLEPDAMIVFSVPEDGGIMVRNAAEAGLSLVIIGTTEWQQEEFPATATISAIEQHQAVYTVGFTHADSPAWESFEPAWSGSEYAELADAGNSYALQYYDLLIVTALAIEAAGSVEADAWTEAVPMVAEAPGTEVFSYAEGLEALRAGEDIDYQGVTGGFDYTDTGVVSGLFGVFEWVSETELVEVGVIDDQAVLELDSDG